jgi:hypothetical protein
METAASILGVGALALMAINHRPIERGWMLPPAGPHRLPGGVLLCADDRLGFFLAVVLIFAY